MIPKLLLNYVIDVKQIKAANDLQYTLDMMKHNKFIYIQVILKNLATPAQLQEFVALFHKFRMTRHVDYTIWVDRNLPETDDVGLKIIWAVIEAQKTNKLVMGLANHNDDQMFTNDMRLRAAYDRLPVISYGVKADPVEADPETLASFNDQHALKHNKDVLARMVAPPGMKAGLTRVVDYHEKFTIQQPVSNSTLEEESPAVSVPDSE